MEPLENNTLQIRNIALKNRKVFLSDGSLGEFDSDGLLAVSRANSVQLLLIPGFELVESS
jgi:hypothetical protein